MWSFIVLLLGHISAFVVWCIIKHQNFRQRTAENSSQSFGRQQHSAQNTNKTNHNQQPQNLTIQNLLCAIDMVCYFSLKYEPNWHADKIKFVRSRFQQFCDNDNDLLFLRNRLKSSTRNLPNIDNNISDFIHKFNNEELTRYIFDTVVCLLAGTHKENLTAVEREAMDFAAKIRLPRHIAKQIVNQIFAEFQDNESKQQTNSSQEQNSSDLEAQAYQTLGISRNASTDEIKAAYRKKMMEFHPDRNPQITETVRKMLNEESHKVKQAYEYLMKLRGIK